MKLEGDQISGELIIGLQVDGPITGRAYKREGGGWGLISGSLRYYNR